MERDLISRIDREQAQAKLERVEPGFSVSESIADELSLTVYDQREASVAVARRLAMWQSGLTESNRPIGVLFFAGPPGVGKTEMAHAVSKYFFNDPRSERLIRLDMSDFQQEHSDQKLTGSPPGYVGYNEEPAIPHRIVNKKDAPTIVLLDEIEKANVTVLRGLLQAFDKGELNARNGRDGFEPLDFTRTLFIMTSNIASQEVVQIEKHGSRRIGFLRDEVDQRDDEIQRIVKEAMKAKFPPEFLDRVDQFVRFMPLENEVTRRSILMKFVNEQNEAFQDRWGNEAPFLALTSEAQDLLLSNKDDKGGRGIKRELQQRVISQMPDVMMGMDFHRRPFVADIEDNQTVWYTDIRNPQLEELRQIPAAILDGKKNETPISSGDSMDGGEGDLKVGVAGGEGEKDKIVPEEEKPSEIGDFGDIPPQNDEPAAKNLTFYVPRDGGDYATMQLSIVIHEKGRRDKLQLIEHIPLLEDIS